MKENMKTFNEEEIARIQFMDKLESEGGLEGLYHYNGFKSAEHLPMDEAIVFADLKEALDKAYALMAKYQKQIDALTPEEDASVPYGR